MSGPVSDLVAKPDNASTSILHDRALANMDAIKAPAQREAALLARISELEAGTKRLMFAYVNTLESGRDRILSLGGQCDPVDVMEANDPALRAARALLAGGKRDG